MSATPIARDGERASRLAHLRGDAFFLVWGSQGVGPRSRVFARELGIEAIFVTTARRRGARTAPARYASQAVRTVRLLRDRRPRLVFVQSPPSIVVMVAAAWCAVSGSRFVVDAHSAAMLSPVWTRPRWLYRVLARRALATIVTDEHHARTIRSLGGRALVIRDIPTAFPGGTSRPSGDGHDIMVVSTFAPDEPLGEILAAARALPEVRFHVTGDASRVGGPPAGAPDNVRFTGYLPDDGYYGLMRGCAAVLCLTTRDHTMQRGACEALWVGRPIVTSDWPLLRRSFSKGTVHVRADATSIRAGVEEMVRHHERYASEIEALRSEHRDDWDEAVARLVTLVDGALAPSGHQRDHGKER